jgi:hypothetical protein
MSPAEEHSNAQDKSNEQRIKELIVKISDAGAINEFNEIMFILNSPCKAYYKRINQKNPT